MKNCDFPQLCESLPEGRFCSARTGMTQAWIGKSRRTKRTLERVPQRTPDHGAPQ